MDAISVNILRQALALEGESLRLARPPSGGSPSPSGDSLKLSSRDSKMRMVLQVNLQQHLLD